MFPADIKPVNRFAKKSDYWCLHEEIIGRWRVKLNSHKIASTIVVFEIFLEMFWWLIFANQLLQIIWDDLFSLVSLKPLLPDVH